MMKNSLLWQITGEHLQAPIYIFGTMHVQDERAFRGINFLEECVAACEVFAAEYNLEEGDEAAFQEAMRLPEGESLEHLLSKNTYRKLGKIFKRETGYDLHYFNSQKPLMLVNMLTNSHFSQDRDISLDAHLFQFAQLQGKELAGLESFESQLGILEGMPIEEQLKQLKEMSTHYERFRRNLQKTVALYLKGDLMKILKKVKKTAGGMRKLLLYDRNIVMANRIEAIGREHSLFAAVGAGHLAGKKGLLNLLKQRGYRATPIKIESTHD